MLGPFKNLGKKIRRLGDKNKPNHIETHSGHYEGLSKNIKGNERDSGPNEFLLKFDIEQDKNNTIIGNGSLIPIIYGEQQAMIRLDVSGFYRDQSVALIYRSSANVGYYGACFFSTMTVNFPTETAIEGTSFGKRDNEQEIVMGRIDMKKANSSP